MPPITLTLTLNLIASTASSLFSLSALYNPTILSSSPTPSSGEIYYSRLYSARSAPLGLLFGLIPFYYQGPVVRWILVTAGVIQAADVLVAIKKGGSVGVGWPVYWDGGAFLGGEAGGVIQGGCVDVGSGLGGLAVERSGPIIDGLVRSPESRKPQRESNIVRHMEILRTTANARVEQVRIAVENVADVVSKPFMVGDMLWRMRERLSLGNGGGERNVVTGKRIGVERSVPEP